MVTPQRKSDQQRSAEVLQKFKESFTVNPGWSPELLEADVNTITTRGTAAEAVMAFLAVPVEHRYASLRRTLLCRILMRPQSELLSTWYKKKFLGAGVLPEEYVLIDEYFGHNPQLARELLGWSKHPRYLMPLEGDVH